MVEVEHLIWLRKIKIIVVLIMAVSQNWRHFICKYVLPNNVSMYNNLKSKPSFGGRAARLKPKQMFAFIKQLINSKNYSTINSNRFESVMPIIKNKRNAVWNKVIAMI